MDMSVLEECAVSIFKVEKYVEKGKRGADTGKG